MNSRILYGWYYTVARNCLLVACLSVTHFACGQDAGQPSQGGDAAALDSPAIGVVVIAIDDEIKAVWLKDKMRAQRWRGGLFVGNVIPGSPAALAGIKSADVIEVKSEGKSLVTPVQFSDWVTALKIGRKYRVTVHRPVANEQGRMIWKNFGVFIKPTTHAKLKATAKAAKASRPPVTLKAVAAMNAVQRSELLGIGIFGNVIVGSIEPVVGGMYRVLGIDLSGSQRMPLGSRSRATAHWIKDRWVQIRCSFDVSEGSALRLNASVKDGSELNIAGKIKQVRVVPRTEDTFEVVHLDLEDVRAR